MPPPSPLAIATSSLQRLVKEEASYHAEQKQQEERIQKLEGRVDGGAGDEPEEDEEERGNREFGLRQEVCFLVLVGLNLATMSYVFEVGSKMGPLCYDL